MRPKKKRPNSTFPMAVKIEAFKRANQSCEECRTPLSWSFEDVEFNHIKPVQDGGDNSLENCQILCHKCHMSPENFKRLHPSAPPVFVFLNRRARPYLMRHYRKKQ